MSRTVKNISGQVFNKLTAVSYVRMSSSGAVWQFRCECGNTVEYRANDVKKGYCVTCGCGRTDRDCDSQLALQYPNSYQTWSGMLNRCNNPQSSDYKNYGLLGVSICDEWLSFSKFVEDMGERPNGLTIDRINTYGNYTKSNCKWSTLSQQASNKRNNVRVLVNGEFTYCLKEFCEVIKLSYSKARYHIKQFGSLSKLTNSDVVVL